MHLTEVLSSLGRSGRKNLMAYPRTPSRLVCSINFKYCVPSGVLQFMAVLPDTEHFIQYHFSHILGLPVSSVTH